MPDLTNTALIRISENVDGKPTVTTIEKTVHSLLSKLHQINSDPTVGRTQGIKSIVRALLFPDDSDIFSYLAKPNPTVPIPEIPGLGKVKFSLSSLIASESLATLLKDDSEPIITDDLSSVIALGNIAIFGGPVNNEATRIVLGTGFDSPYFRLFKGTQYHAGPPVRVDITDFNEKSPPKSQPNWDFLIEGTKVPLSGELLLLTSLPNPFRPKARIVIVASRFGAGVRAIKLLLSDMERVAWLFKQQSVAPGWQLLVKVNTAEFNGIATPTSLGEQRFFPIKQNFEFDNLDAIDSSHSFFQLISTIGSQHVKNNTNSRVITPRTDINSGSKETNNNQEDDNVRHVINYAIGSVPFEGGEENVLSSEDALKKINLYLSKAEILARTVRPEIVPALREMQEPKFQRGDVAAIKPPVPSLTEDQIASLWTREKWRARKDKSEKFPTFLKRVYGDLLGHGLVTTDFKRKDPKTGKPYEKSLYQARLDWIKHNDIPNDIDLPTQEEVTDRLAYAMASNPSSLSLETQAHVKMALALRAVRKLANG